MACQVAEAGRRESWSAPTIMVSWKPRSTAPPRTIPDTTAIRTTRAKRGTISFWLSGRGGLDIAVRGVSPGRRTTDPDILVGGGESGQSQTTQGLPESNPLP